MKLKELKAGSKNERIFRIKNIDGEVRWINNHVRCVEDDHSGKLRIYGAAQDITQLKQREETIEKSLREKEVLLQEIHHRVKNNMQIISSLLSLQADFVDEDMRGVLEGSQNRVKSMALVHEKLYQSQSLRRIEMADYIQSLVSNLFYSYITKKDQINLIFEIEDIKFNIETAIPCGLIINELISNSLKYAFPSGRNGEMHISLKLKEDNYELIVKDDGIGFPEDLEFENMDSLGLKLVNSLINQLEGELEVDRGRGTEFKITFRELEYKKDYNGFHILNRIINLYSCFMKI
jgi:two-component sensor histidine kinase